MSIVKLTELISGAATKYLSRVDADLNASNGHEIGGLVRAGFREYLPDSGEANAILSYIRDDEDPVTISDTVTWYDSRKNDPTRGPEFRLYYKDNAVTEAMNPGDFFLIAKLADGRLIIVITPCDSNCEHELRALFNTPLTIDKLSASPPKSISISIPVRIVLEEIGIELPIEQDSAALNEMIDIFGNEFPTTKKMSEFARSRITVDAIATPDHAILAWMEEEEKLFRIFERHLVESIIQSQIIEQSVDIDNFVSLSLSIHNRRKSRVGHAFENHLTEIFTLNGLRFERGSSKKVTENKSKPDFLFPGFTQYHDDRYSSDMLRVLGAKTSLKDRWRQVLAEADKIKHKHLVTLQSGISDAQFEEMQSNKLQLVIPEELAAVFPAAQRERLLTLATFIDEVRHIQQY